MSNIHLYEFGEYKAESGCGVREYLYQLSHLLKNDLHIHFINFTLEDPRAHQIAREEDRIFVHKFGKLKQKGWVFPKGFQRWLAKLNPRDKSIFHLHSVFRLSNYRMARLLNKFKVPYIFTPHDSYSPESLNTKGFLKKISLQSTEKYVLNQARLIHAITPIGARHISKYTDNQIKTVCNFVPDAQVAQMNPEKGRHICFIGRFDIQQKGIDLQLKAFKLFKKNWKNRKQEPPAFLLIGRKTKREQLTVEKLCQDLSLKRNKEVLLTGPVSDYEKYNLLYRAHVYLQLSRYEGFGLSCVEAMALGKPIIISSKIPIKDYVQQFDAGWVVNNPREAAKALREVYQMGESEYHLKSKNARACYEAFFHPNVIKPQLLDMIAQAASVQIKKEAILKSSK